MVCVFLQCTHVRGVRAEGQRAFYVEHGLCASAVHACREETASYVPEQTGSGPRSEGKGPGSYLQGVDAVCVSLQRMSAALALRVPDFHCVVVRAAHHLVPVVLHTAHGSHVPHQHMQTLPSLDVPEAQSGIPRATHNPVSKGALGACISSRPHPAELSQGTAAF